MSRAIQRTITKAIETARLRAEEEAAAPSEADRTVTKLVMPPAPAETYVAAYSPHTPLRSLEEYKSERAEVRSFGEIVPNGVPMLPTEKTNWPAIALAIGAAFVAIKILKVRF